MGTSDLPSDIEEKKRTRTRASVATASGSEEEQQPSHSPLSHRFRTSSRRRTVKDDRKSREESVSVTVSGTGRNERSGESAGEVDEILSEKEGPNGTIFRIQLVNGRKEEVSSDVTVSCCSI